MVVPPNHPKLDSFSIENHGLGDPPVWETSIYIHVISFNKPEKLGPENEFHV